MVYRLSCGFVMISMKREEIRKLIESYAESKVEGILKEIEDCDSFKNQDFEFIEYDWLMSGDKLWMIIEAYDIDEKEIEQYYDIEKGYSYIEKYHSCGLRISMAVYCPDEFDEANEENNEHFDGCDFENFEKNHDYEEC